MPVEEEMKILLRGIQRLRFELQYADWDNDFSESYDKYSRLQNLLWCMNQVCWKVYGDREEDKEIV